MSVSVAQTFRVTQATLSGTLTQVSPPAGLDVYEALVTSTAAFTVADKAAGPAFPVAANDSMRLPVTLDTMKNETGRGLFLSGTGTATIMWLGLPSVSAYTNS